MLLSLLRRNTFLHFKDNSNRCATTEHIAIMKKSWGLTEKILTGGKTLESRWYLSKRAPWGVIRAGEKVYFKDSGEPVSIRATVSRVEHYEHLTPKAAGLLLEKIRKDDGIPLSKLGKYRKLFGNKKYCVLVYLVDPVRTRPFGINKKGFGAMSAWISVDSVDRIRRTYSVGSRAHSSSK